mmetsp:Transcript_70051/g.222023  ORF Transcript_70051/g.222023 Transcript_70051/m.222023 type:complete len:393 (-) Transcript_70051:2208-3386(-)
MGGMAGTASALCAVLVAIFISECSGAPSVTSIKTGNADSVNNGRTEGSIYGGTRLWIFGLELGDNALGATYVSLGGKKRCNLVPYFSQADTLLVCDTEPLTLSERLDYVNYNNVAMAITVMIDGSIEVKPNYNWMYKDSFSPIYYYNYPRGGSPGDFVTVRGEFRSGETKNVRSIIFGEDRCSLQTLADDSEGDGVDLRYRPQCFVGENSQPGWKNVTVNMAVYFGDSGHDATHFYEDANNAFAVNPAGVPYNFAVKPAIESLSSAIGSVAGGHLVTIKGRGFGLDPTKVAVAFDGDAATVVSATADELVVLSPSDGKTRTVAADKCTLDRECLPLVCGSSGACAACSDAEGGVACPHGYLCSSGQCVAGAVREEGEKPPKPQPRWAFGECN